jgi:hypothetical protein
MSVAISTNQRRALPAGVTVIVALAFPAATLGHAAPPTEKVLPADVVTAAVSPAQLPTDPDAGIKVGTGADALRVILPANAASGAARHMRPGQVMYDGADADTAVSADQRGVSIATIAPAAGRNEQRFHYRVELPDGQALVRQGDGSISIRSHDGAVSATIEAPWAQDSTGRFLPTSYTVDGASLTQTVNTVGAVGAVTADPHLVLHGPRVVVLPPSIEPPYLTLWLTRHETEEAYRSTIGISSATTAAGAVCSVLGAIANVTPQTKAIITVVCAAISVYAQDLRNNLQQAHDNHTCLNVDVKPPNIGLNPIDLINLVREITTGELPVLDFNDNDGPDCDHS